MSRVRERRAAAGPDNRIMRRPSPWPCQQEWSAGEAGPRRRYSIGPTVSRSSSCTGPDRAPAAGLRPSNRQSGCWYEEG